MTKKDNIFVLALKLFIICLVVALGLSALNYITEPIITQLTETKKAEAMQSVLPNCELEKYNDSVYIGKENGQIKEYNYSWLSNRPLDSSERSSKEQPR